MGVSCERPVPKIDLPEEEIVSEVKPVEKEEKRNMILVGKKAPAFRAPAFHEGKFTEVGLTDFLGKWVMLCFYPGDFTFV